MIRLWLVVAVLTVLSWLILKVVRKPINFFWVLLFWLAAIWGTMGGIYLLSVLLAQN